MEPENYDDHKETVNPKSGHKRPPLWLLAIWFGFFIYMAYYLYTYMWPDLLKWLE